MVTRRSVCGQDRVPSCPFQVLDPQRTKWPCLFNIWESSIVFGPWSAYIVYCLIPFWWNACTGKMLFLGETERTILKLIWIWVKRHMQANILHSRLVTFHLCLILTPQIWRFVTSFLFYGYIGFSFLFNMIFLYPHTESIDSCSYIVSFQGHVGGTWEWDYLV